MEIIAHRRNLSSELAATPKKYGVEVDIRSFGPDLVIHHDPYVKGTLFEEWIDLYRHGTLILNVKEEGLEERLLKLMQQRGINRFFFLDQSFPFLIRTARIGERRCAVRVSEFESVETAIAVAPMIDWVWVDCFTKFPLSLADTRRLKERGLKLCLVSPELQGRPPEASVGAMRREIQGFEELFDAVCTKRPDLWLPNT
ncbi:hypothetical protein JQ582_39170 [Bradyrhizobium japonicum]|uniref:phosphatidylinositol-specific phospholipase C/glycerophosphodiester phosphodiesterase family protein n=1 Tax=Bradyrhizobium japonicum TaxID=375 RepID=UPI001BA53A3C|nr:phosphatidylinositol-specific phospholipase C/glycerophosphodiester phosphodiesterase family protein [Bradyrhizobium japonicum]MBR0749949.1 hypothetical protein [Bradyrhizobium japonicum]